MCQACPASEAVQALSKQPTQQHHPTLRVVPSLKCKMRNECEVCQVCRFPSQSFSFSCIMRMVATANLAELNFPLVCDDAIG